MNLRNVFISSVTELELVLDDYKIVLDKHLSEGIIKSGRELAEEMARFKARMLDQLIMSSKLNQDNRR